jgi:hypothetical protein
MLKTFTGGAFSKKDSIADIYEAMKKKSLDPVGQEDGDIDNDGDQDSSDKYLAKRRKAISKSMKKDNSDEPSELKISGKKDDIKVMKNEETKKIDEGSDYQLYHKTFSGAMDHAYQIAKKKGYTVDTDDIDRKVAMGPKKPSNGKTNRYILGTDKKKNLHVQVANLDDKRYELNMYIEDVDFDTNLSFLENKENIQEKSVSIKQQRFMGMVRAAQKGENPASKEVADAAKNMKKKDVKDFASTEHKGLPMKKEEVSFDEAFDVKTAKTKFGKITVKSFDNHDDAKAHLELMKKRGHKGIISQAGKPVNEEEVLEACWPGYKQVGMKKKGDRMVPNCVKEDSLQEAKMSDAAALKALKALATNGKNEKTKSFANGVIKFYAKNKSFTPDQIAGLQNIMKNAGFQMAKEEKFTKGLSKINKLMEKRSMLKGGAGEEGTDDLVKKYKENTPGQSVSEGNIVVKNNDPYSIFEKMIHYKMGISVNNIDDFSAYRENDTIVITHNVFGNKAIVSEDDVKAFYDSYSFDLNEFSNIISQFGIKISSKENIEKMYGDEDGFAYDTLHKDPTEIDENANVSKYSNFITTNMITQKNGFVLVK